MSVTSAEPAPDPSCLPSLRLLPVPVCEPPYDDELAAPLSVVPDPAHPLGPLRRLSPPLSLVPELPERADAEPAVPRTSAADLPAARPVAHALVQGLLEVLSGVRPVSQLQRGTTPELFAALEQTVHSRPRATGSRPRTGAVRSLHVQQRPEGVAEVCATVSRDGRAAAIALRLEGIGGRWCCTELMEV